MTEEGGYILAYFDRDAMQDTPTGVPDWQPLGLATSHSFSSTLATRDTSNKTSGKAMNREASRLDWSARTEGLVAYDDGEINYIEMLNAQQGRKQIRFLMCKKTADGNNLPRAGEKAREGFAYIGTLDENSGDAENVTYSLNVSAKSKLRTITIGGDDGQQWPGGILTFDTILDFSKTI